MFPYSKSYSPVTASVTGFVSNATGATWTLSTTATSDGLAHTVTIHNDAATDHSAKTALLTGTDADGHAITETMGLPAGTATTTSLKYFKTLTTIVPSATVGADTMDVGWSAVSVTPTFPIDAGAQSGSTVVVDISGTINFTGEETFTTPFSQTAFPADSNTWYAMSGMTAKTADAVSSTTVTATATHIKTNSVTNGATLAVIVRQPARS